MKIYDIDITGFTENTSNVIVESMTRAIINNSANTEKYFTNYNIISDRTNSP